MEKKDSWMANRTTKLLVKYHMQGSILTVVRSSVTTKISDGQPKVIRLVVRRTTIYFREEDFSSSHPSFDRLLMNKLSGQIVYFTVFSLICLSNPLTIFQCRIIASPNISSQYICRPRLVTDIARLRTVPLVR